MSAKPLHARVAEIERLAATDPARYHRRLKALVAVGILVYVLLAILAVAVLGLQLAIGRIQIALLIAGFAALYGLLAAFFIRGDDRSGPSFPISRADAPGLWQKVDELCERLGTASVEEATLDLDFNAAVARRARFLLWGRGRTELRLGLPLVLMCDVNELASILTHELGHHRAGHAHTHVRTLRIALAMQDVAQRFARQGGLAAYVILPVASWYVPRLNLMVLPIQREHEREADRAEVSVGLGEAGARAMARAEMLGPWFAQHFLTHRPSFAGLRAGMERTLDLEILRRKIREALERPGVPDDEHPAFAERVALLGVPLTPEDDAGIARLAKSAGSPSSDRAWTSLFAPEFRGRVEAFADEMFAAFGSGAPAAEAETGLEGARELAATGDEAGAIQAFRDVAQNAATGPVALLEAARALTANDPRDPVAVEAHRRAAADPFVGLDALIDVARDLAEQYQSGRVGVSEAMVKDATGRVTTEHNARRALVAALHKDPRGGRLEGAAFPPDISRELAQGVAAYQDAHRAWTFWAGHAKVPGVRVPLLVIDSGIEAKAFRLTNDDPKKVAAAIEESIPAPAAIAVLIGWGNAELTTLVGETAPFWNPPPRATPPD